MNEQQRRTLRMIHSGLFCTLYVVDAVVTPLQVSAPFSGRDGIGGGRGNHANRKET